MIRPSAYLVLLPLALTAACSSTNNGTLRTEAMPELEQQKQEIAQEAAKQKDFQAVLLRLDQAMESYANALSNRGEPIADAEIDKIGMFLQDTVLDTGARRFVRTKEEGKDKPSQHVPGDVFRRLQAQATDGSNPYQQGTALAALGFSGRTDMMNLIAQGAMLDNVEVVDRAVFGLAILQAPGTPPGVLAKIIDDPQHPEDGRAQAAWCLYRIQEVNADHKPFADIWRRYLGADRDQVPPAVLVSALRGLGLTRNKQHADVVAPFLKHPVPRLRMTAALALGRMKSQEHWRDLYELLKPQENVQNVRLHARLALAELAGTDYQYDLAAWRSVFERGTDKDQ